MRGGVSSKAIHEVAILASSPHAWGCFLILFAFVRFDFVFPTCVGVFLFSNRALLLLARLPHMRGGVSEVLGFSSLSFTSSPHAWGCFSVYKSAIHRL